MAGRLRLKFTPYAAPGNLELSYIEEVASVSATLAHWKEKVKESGSKEAFVEVVGAKEDTNGKALSAETYLVNVNQIQAVVEY